MTRYIQMRHTGSIWVHILAYPKVDYIPAEFNYRVETDKSYQLMRNKNILSMPGRRPNPNEKLESFRFKLNPWSNDGLAFYEEYLFYPSCLFSPRKF